VTAFYNYLFSSFLDYELGLYSFVTILLLKKSIGMPMPALREVLSNLEFFARLSAICSFLEVLLVNQKKFTYEADLLVLFNLDCSSSRFLIAMTYLSSLGSVCIDGS